MALRIKPELRKTGMTQAAFAERLGISTGYLSLLVNGQREPSPALLRDMADALGVRVSDLFDEPQAPGFAESTVAFVKASQTELRAICRILELSAKTPTLYEASSTLPAFGIFRGDQIVADLGTDRDDPGLVIATTADPNTGNANTEIFRQAPPWLIPSDPSEPPIDRTGAAEIAVLGKIVGIYRRT